MKTVLRVPPANEPITLDQVKQNVRQLSDVHDNLIADLIRSARSSVENKLGIACVEQQWSQYRDNFNAGVLRIPRPPLISVEGVYYRDGAGQEQLLDPSVYEVDIYKFPGEIMLAHGATWPTTQRSINAVRIEYTCGYGKTQHEMPDSLQQGLILWTAYLYYNPSMEGQSSFADIFTAFLGDHMNWLVDELP